MWTKKSKQQIVRKILKIVSGDDIINVWKMKKNLQLRVFFDHLIHFLTNVYTIRISCKIQKNCFFWSEEDKVIS